MKAVLFDFHENRMVLKLNYPTILQGKEKSVMHDAGDMGFAYQECWEDVKYLLSNLILRG